MNGCLLAIKQKEIFFLFNQDNFKLAFIAYGKRLELHENLDDDVYKAPLLNEIARLI